MDTAQKITLLFAFAMLLFAVGCKTPSYNVDTPSAQSGPGLSNPQESKPSICQTQLALLEQATSETLPQQKIGSLIPPKLSIFPILNKKGQIFASYISLAKDPSSAPISLVEFCKKESGAPCFATTIRGHEALEGRLSQGVYTVRARSCSGGPVNTSRTFASKSLCGEITSVDYEITSQTLPDVIESFSRAENAERTLHNLIYQLRTLAQKYQHTSSLSTETRNALNAIIAAGEDYNRLIESPYFETIVMQTFAHRNAKSRQQQLALASNPDPCSAAAANYDKTTLPPHPYISQTLSQLQTSQTNSAPSSTAQSTQSTQQQELEWIQTQEKFYCETVLKAKWNQNGNSPTCQPPPSTNSGFVGTIKSYTPTILIVSGAISVLTGASTMLRFSSRGQATIAEDVFGQVIKVVPIVGTFASDLYTGAVGKLYEKSMLRAGYVFSEQKKSWEDPKIAGENPKEPGKASIEFEEKERLQNEITKVQAHLRDLQREIDTGHQALQKSSDTFSDFSAEKKKELAMKEGDLAFSQHKIAVMQDQIKQVSVPSVEKPSLSARRFVTPLVPVVLGATMITVGTLIATNNIQLQLADGEQAFFAEAQKIGEEIYDAKYALYLEHNALLGQFLQFSR